MLLNKENCKVSVPYWGSIFSNNMNKTYAFSECVSVPFWGSIFSNLDVDRTVVINGQMFPSPSGVLYSLICEKKNN